MTDTFKRRGQVLHEFIHVVGPTVRQLPFGKRPHSLVRVEFGSVRREVLNSQPGVSTTEDIKRLSLVSSGVVQYGDDGST